MGSIEDVSGELQGLVGAGELVGFVLGDRRGGVTRMVAGGSCSVDGAPMRTDAQFVLTSNTKPFGGVLAMRLVESGRVGLDDPVTEFLPELADARVLQRSDGPLDETVPAERPITLRHLLTMTAGFGWVADPGPLSEAMSELQVAPGPYAPPMGPDEYMRRLGSLPLATQPGTAWLYHTSSDVLGVLLSRATGSSVGELLEEHVLGPLELTDTGFTGDAARMPTPYGADEAGALTSLHQPEGLFTNEPQFESLACGLVSTVSDYLRFLDVVAVGRPVLSRGAAIQLASDQITSEQRVSAEGFIERGSGYGFQVEIRPDGSVGWAGGLGTIGYTNPMRDCSAVLFTAQSIAVPGTGKAFDQFWTLLR